MDWSKDDSWKNLSYPSSGGGGSASDGPPWGCSAIVILLVALFLWYAN